MKNTTISQIVHRSTYNVNGQLVGCIVTDIRNLGPTEITIRYGTDGREIGRTEIDLGLSYFWQTLRREGSTLPFRIEDVVSGKHNDLLTYPA